MYNSTYNTIHIYNYPFRCCCVCFLNNYNQTCPSSSLPQKQRAKKSKKKRGFNPVPSRHGSRPPSLSLYLFRSHSLPFWEVAQVQYISTYYDSRKNLRVDLSTFQVGQKYLIQLGCVRTVPAYLEEREWGKGRRDRGGCLRGWGRRRRGLVRSGLDWDGDQMLARTLRVSSFCDGRLYIVFLFSVRRCLRPLGSQQGKKKEKEIKHLYLRTYSPKHEIHFFLL